MLARYGITLTVAAMVMLPPCIARAGVDLAALPRKLVKEPAYQSKSPKYVLLVFGPEAATRVWVVADIVGEPSEKDGSRSVLYVDRNGNSDLTEPGERVPCGKMIPHTTVFFTLGMPDSTSYAPHFDVGDIVDADGKTRCTGLSVDVESYIQDYRPMSFSVAVEGLGRMSAGGSLLRPGVRPDIAPVIHFNGPLTMKLAMDSGRLNIPIDYEHEKPGPPRDAWYASHPPTYDPETLKRGQSSRLVAVIGTPGLGRGTFAVVPIDAVPADVQPQAQVTFDPTDPNIPLPVTRAALKQRCCGTLFYTTIDIPAAAAAGDAKVTLSLPDWPGRAVAPAQDVVSVTDAAPAR